MAVKLKNSLRDIEDYLRRCADVVDAESTRTLSRLGEEAVKTARDRPMSESWIDHTGNLRSSIGYAVYKRGQETISNGFKSTAAPEGNGNEGQTEGRRFLAEVASGKANANSHVLIVVAGMNYADYVESLENKDVLATAELTTRAKMPQYIAKTKARIDAIISKI